MSSETFVQDMGLPVNADISHVESAFMARMKERLQHIADNYDEVEVKAEEAWLRAQFKDFFVYARDWIRRETARFVGQKEYQGADRVKKDAEQVLDELESYITEFSSCYMHLNRFMTLLRDEIRAEEVKLSTGSYRNIKWTADSGIMIARYRKEKQLLVARTDRMSEARKMLEKIEDYFINIKKALINLYGKEKAEPLMRKINSALRTMDERKLRKALREISDSKSRFGVDQKTTQSNLQYVENTANALFTLIMGNVELLTGEEGRVFLRPIETDVAYNSDIKDLQKIKGFLAKYHLPYMQYKLDSLSHLKEKLLVINSLESLMTLYKRLIMGIAVPLKDIKVIRMYENDVLNHVKYLLSGHFQELPKILQRAEETVQEFRITVDEIEEITGMEFVEKEVDRTQLDNA